ncbi:MAG: anthranilate phosphoribosyltransferase, partial [Oscillospiraceae bacterium]|nr:anthranilate phosphoribosyltransferase [Oscillospiraceae bacterium]
PSKAAGMTCTAANSSTVAKNSSSMPHMAAFPSMCVKAASSPSVPRYSGATRNPPNSSTCMSTPEPTASSSSMKYVGAIRRELGIRTVFNILGPLTNPAKPTYALLGVYDESLVEIVAQVMMKLGVERGMVVYGTDKLDEISLSAETRICEFRDGETKLYTVKPEDFNLPRCKKDDLTGGDPAENAAITRAILNGSELGHKRNAVLLNAGALLYIAKKAESFADGVKLAAELIDSGKAEKKLEAFIAESNR